MYITQELKELVERLEKDKELCNYLEDNIRSLLYEDYIYSGQEETWNNNPEEWVQEP